MKTKKYLSIIIVLIFCFLAFGATNSLKNPLTESITTKTILPDNSPKNDLTGDYKTIYLKMITEGLNSIWENVEVQIGEDSIITVDISDNLTDKEVQYVMAMMDAYDDEYWSYEKKEDLVQVVLSFNNGHKEFSISLNSESNEFNI